MTRFVLNLMNRKYFLNKNNLIFMLCLNLDVPAAPSVPEVSDITDSSLKLTWSAPSFDGGAPITSYTVDYMKKGEIKWIPLETGTADITYTVPGLKVGADYVFRVSASNKVGTDILYMY